MGVDPTTVKTQLHHLSSSLPNWSTVSIQNILYYITRRVVLSGIWAHVLLQYHSHHKFPLFH